MDAQLLPTTPAALSCEDDDGGLELVVVVFFLIIPISMNLLNFNSTLRTVFTRFSLLRHLLDYCSVQTTLETCVVIITTSMHFHFAHSAISI